jgi:hypothetical protein
LNTSQTTPPFSAGHSSFAPKPCMRFHDRVVELAVQAKVVKGRKLREDWHECANEYPSSHR